MIIKCCHGIGVQQAIQSIGLPTLEITRSKARRSIEGKNWTAAGLTARSAVQLVARSHGATGKNLKEEIDDLASKGLILPSMTEFAHEVRVLANEGTHPQPGTTGTNEKDAKDVVEFLSFLMTVMYNLPKQIKDYGRTAKWRK